MLTNTAVLKKRAETLVATLRCGGSSPRREVAAITNDVMGPQGTLLASVERNRAMLEAEMNAFERSRAKALAVLDEDTWSARFWRRLRGAPSHVEEAQRQVDLMAFHMDAADIACALVETHARYLLDDAERVSEALAVLNLVEFEVEEGDEGVSALHEQRRQLLLTQAAYRRVRLLLVHQKARATLRAEMQAALAKTALIVQGHSQPLGFA
jgi:hypothetical protein